MIKSDISDKLLAAYFDPGKVINLPHFEVIGFYNDVANEYTIFTRSKLHKTVIKTIVKSEPFDPANEDMRDSDLLDFSALMVYQQLIGKNWIEI